MGFREGQIKFEKATTDKLKWIHSKLAQLDSLKVPTYLKEDIARVAYRIMNTSPPIRDEIIGRAFTLSEFIDYEYDDTLDEVFANLATLLPAYRNDVDYIFDVWEKAKTFLNTYLVEHGLKK